MISFDNGISIDGLPFRLDASRVSELSYISHAHSDHTRRHKKVICTPETALLYKLAYSKVPVRAIPFGREVRIDGATVELFPSGHMLGASQILVRTNRQRVVYTGDLKIYPNLTCPEIETRRCDILIMESTYGDPAFSFPPQNEVYTRIIMFVKRCFADNYIPVLAAYAMGKAQEAISLLQKHGFQVCVDNRIEAVNKCYRAAGVSLAQTYRITANTTRGKVLVVTPQTLRDEDFKKLYRKRSLFLSGWSQNRQWNFGTDSAVPLSDHADFTQLVSYIEKCRPKKIFTLHGEEKFAKLLREMGWDAEYMTKGFQSEADINTNQLKPPHPISTGDNFELF